MREIKYRIPWRNSDGSFSGFTYWGRIDHKNEPSAECFTSPGQWGGRRAGSDEQFTGLSDKNGKEIYEGDIVSIEHILVYERTVSHPKRNAIMTWDEGETGFRLSSDSVKNTNPDIYPVCCLEVIGNIHENPELLK